MTLLQIIETEMNEINLKADLAPGGELDKEYNVLICATVWCGEVSSEWERG